MTTEPKFIEVGTNSQGLPARINIAEIVTVRYVGDGNNEIILTAKDKDGSNIIISSKVPLKTIFDMIDKAKS